MKIFKFDPKTGKRGEQIDEKQVTSWAGCGLEYAIREGHVCPVDFICPKGSADQNVTVHTDAGRTDKDGHDFSYQHDTEWIAFCTGKWNGADTKDGYAWEWIILPPKGLLQWIEEPDCSPAGEPC